jgi:hypothetical protein
VPFGQDDGAVNLFWLRGRVVVVRGRFDFETERSEAGHVRLDGARAQGATAGERQVKVLILVHERAEEHDDGARLFGGFDVHVVQLQVFWRYDFEVAVVVQPADFHANALQDFDDAIDFLDFGHAAQNGLAVVEQGGAEQGDGSVFAGLHFYSSRKSLATVDAEVQFAGTVEHHDVMRQYIADSGDHFKTDVLTAFFYAVDGTLASAERFG